MGPLVSPTSPILLPLFYLSLFLSRRRKCCTHVKNESAAHGSCAEAGADIPYVKGAAMDGSEPWC
jgi:hypothetical protein